MVSLSCSRISLVIAVVCAAFAATVMLPSAAFAKSDCAKIDTLPSKAQQAQMAYGKKCAAAPVAPAIAVIGSAEVTVFDSPAPLTIRLQGRNLSTLANIEFGASAQGLMVTSATNPAGPYSWLMQYKAAGYTISWTDTEIVVYDPSIHPMVRSVDSIYNVIGADGNYLFVGGVWGANYLNLVPTFTV